MVEPVPPASRPPRITDWSRDKMVAFLRELGATHSVSRAAHKVGMSRQSAYKLKKRTAWFAKTWDELLDVLPRAVPAARLGGAPACPLCGAVRGR